MFAFNTIEAKIVLILKLSIRFLFSWNSWFVIASRFLQLFHTTTKTVAFQWVSFSGLFWTSTLRMRLRLPLLWPGEGHAAQNVRHLSTLETLVTYARKLVAPSLQARMRWLCPSVILSKTFLVVFWRLALGMICPAVLALLQSHQKLWVFKWCFWLIKHNWNCYHLERLKEVHLKHNSLRLKHHIFTRKHNIEYPWTKFQMLIEV